MKGNQSGVVTESDAEKICVVVVKVVVVGSSLELETAVGMVKAFVDGVKLLVIWVAFYVGLIAARSDQQLTMMLPEVMIVGPLPPCVALISRRLAPHRYGYYFDCCCGCSRDARQ